MEQYGIMNNHYHLLIKTPYGNLSRGMRQLNGLYTQRFNQRHQQVGHLLQGRYKVDLIGTAIFFDIPSARTYNLYIQRIALIVAAGYPHHITQRGNYRQKIFADDTVRRRYLSLLKEAF